LGVALRERLTYIAAPRCHIEVGPARGCVRTSWKSQSRMKTKPRNMGVLGHEIETDSMINSQISSELKKPLDNNEIAQCAYLLWKQAGHPQGLDLKFWLQAEAQLLAARQREAGGLEPRKTESLQIDAALPARSVSPRVETPKLMGAKPTPSLSRKASGRR
jgi:hypothetical protein